MSYKKVCGNYWYPPTSLGTLNPSFTTTRVCVPGGSVTFYVRKGTEMPSTMSTALSKHRKSALPPIEGGIQRSND
jgi:hypothetical protein